MRKVPNADDGSVTSATTSAVTRLRSCATSFTRLRRVLFWRLHRRASPLASLPPA